MAEWQNSEDLEIMFTRNVLCEMIEISMKDVLRRRKYKRANTKNQQSKNRKEAEYFLRSRAFTGICNALGLSSKAFREKAFGLEEGL